MCARYFWNTQSSLQCSFLPPSMISGPIFAFLLLQTQLHEGGPVGWRPVEGGFCSEFVGEKTS